MRSHVLLLLIPTTIACEHASELDAGPTLAMPAATADASEAGVSVSRELPVPVRQYALEIEPSRRRVRLRDLPMPPSDEPKRYDDWLHSLSVDQLADVTAYCSRQRHDYQFVCGGIGPLHIPVPPRLVPMPVRRVDDAEPRSTGPRHYFASMEAWDRSLNPLQQRYIADECAHDRQSLLCGVETPLVIVFGNEPIAYATGGQFAFQPGVPLATDWPTAATPWLVLDRDGNGAIDSGAELFGGRTPLAAGGTATNGFVALAELDSDGNGRIDRDDAAFARLQLWADSNGDRRTTPNELTPASTRMESIALANHVDLRCDVRGNCEGERAEVRWRDADGTLQTGSVVDIYLRVH